MMEQSAVHVRIEGRVQGVGYRYFALEKALALGLTGWVRNLADGQVEGQAQGPREALHAWIKELKRGPQMARVSHVIMDWQSPDASLATFEIR